MGMLHDFDAEHGGENGACNGQGIMSYGSAPNVWSTCSKNDFAALYNSVVGSSSKYWCLDGTYILFICTHGHLLAYSFACFLRDKNYFPCLLLSLINDWDCWGEHFFDKEVFYYSFVVTSSHILNCQNLYSFSSFLAREARALNLLFSFSILFRLIKFLIFSYDLCFYQLSKD